MKAVLDEELIYEILSVVEEIPEGNVATYGQIARLIGRERNSRLVGKVLSMAEYYGSYPCHRVVNHAGRLVPGWREQAKLLADEGVELNGNGCVDLKKYLWECLRLSGGDGLKGSSLFLYAHFPVHRMEIGCIP